MIKKYLRFSNIFMDRKIIKKFIKLLFLFILIFSFSYLFSKNTIDSQNIILQSQITYNYLESLRFIIINNSIVMMIILSGLILGKWVVYLFLITNGISIGIFASKIPIEIFLIGTLPHGFLEISCFVLMGVLVTVKFKKVNAKQFLVPFLGIIIASFIEVFITPWILQFII